MPGGPVRGLKHPGEEMPSALIPAEVFLASGKKACFALIDMVAGDGLYSLAAPGTGGLWQE